MNNSLDIRLSSTTKLCSVSSRAIDSNENNERAQNHFPNVVLPVLLAFSLTFLAGLSSFGQEITMDYIPPKGTNVSAEDYRKGKFILTNTYQSIKDHDDKIVYADFWNVGTAYSYMGVDHDAIMIMFRESKRMNSDSFAEVVAHAMNGKNPNDNRLIQLLGQPFKDLVRDCNMELKPTTLAQRMDEKRALDLKGLNENLIDQLLILMDKDQRYRYSTVSYKDNWAAQNKLDLQVQLSLAKLLNEHGYPGQSVVGEKYAGYACLLLEHGGELAHQEKYFPLVKKAFKAGEAPRNCVLMLIDRIHWKKTKKQIFGSHVGVPLDRDEVIDKVKEDFDW